jgi:hypothetical protein
VDFFSGLSLVDGIVSNMCSSDGLEGDALGLVDQALGLLRAAGRRPLGGAVSDVALTQLMQKLEAAVRVARGHQSAVVAEIADRQAHRGQAANTTTDLLARTLHLSQGEARRQAELAEGLAALPATAAALADGRIGVGQAEVAVRKAAEVKGREGGDVLVSQIDVTASQSGQTMDRNRLARQIDTELATANADLLADRERRAFTRRTLSWTVRDGLHVLHAELDPVGGTCVRAMLDSLSDKADDRDARSFPQRQADALVHMAGLAQQAQADHGRPEATLQGARVLLITTPDALHGTAATEPAVIDGHGPVSTALAQQMCCDAAVQVVATSRNGDILDAGRTRRLPTPRQRAAVIARDRHCVGCQAPVSHCQIHHIRWWGRDHGPTDLDNLVLVCWRCHTHIHQLGWQITQDTTGRYQTGPPGHDPYDPHIDKSIQTEPPQLALSHTG